MTALLVGFDSAWTPQKEGAIVAAIWNDDGTFRAVDAPQSVDFSNAASVISAWQDQLSPESTLILIDQPTIVENASGQRPVEHIVCSGVSARRGGMQPANTSRAAMFGSNAPIWTFLERFGGAVDPRSRRTGQSAVFETYPVLTMMAMDWVRQDERVKGRLLKYNPGRKKTFQLEDWQYLCEQVAAFFRARGIVELADWAETVRYLDRPRKGDQDKLDACLCLLVAVNLAARDEMLIVGDRESGQITVPYSAELHEELADRCRATGKATAHWVKSFRFRPTHKN